MAQQTDTEEHHGGVLNVNQLKYIAAAFMVIDNTYFCFDMVLPSWIHLITRFVAPLFAFLMVEGFFHTHDRKKYMLRLWTAAALMEAGDVLSLLLLGKKYQINDNIFLTFAVGFTIIYLLSAAKSAEEAGRRKLLRFLGIFMFVACCILAFLPAMIGDFTVGLEAGMQLFPLILILYLFYGNRKKQIIVFLIWNALFILLLGGVILPGPDYPTMAEWFDEFCTNSDGLVFLFIPFVLLYNGQKGSKSSFNKYFFYIFYPLHLWLIHIAAFFILK